MKTKIVIAGLLFILAFQRYGCTQARYNEPIEFGPNMRTDLVFFFQKGTPPKEIEKFLLRDGLVIPAENGTGYYLPKGMGTGFGITHDGLGGYGLDFKNSASAEQRFAIKSRIEKSPIIYKVFENVIPNEIKDL